MNAALHKDFLVVPVPPVRMRGKPRTGITPTNPLYTR